MASGLPDFYRGVDIAYQALSQMIVRPKYGAAKLIKGVETATANEKISILSVLGKGMIYGGDLRVIGTERQILDVPVLSIEGVEISDTNFGNLCGWGLDMEHSGPFYIRLCDNVNFLYSVGISFGFTFETSFEVLYDEKDGGTPLVSCRLSYSLI